ncbi:MAG: lipocalin family protein [Calditrichaeota bacterium]|nr:lipocalin family protein [Calditrichota bacterium]
MKSLSLVLLIVAVLISFENISAQDTNNKRNLTTVDSVNINKYMGLWYEIAKIPNSFQDQCLKNTTAEYRLQDDGTVEVINSCDENDDSRDKATGLARVVDRKTNAKLEVSFVSIFGWHLFWGDYWIIGLADDYRYAVVGTPSKKYGWILSRTARLDDEDLIQVHAILRDNGYNPNDFEMTPQEAD